MASPCFRAQAARQGIPRLNLRSQKRHVRFSGAKAAVKPQFAAHSRMVGRPSYSWRCRGCFDTRLTWCTLQVDRFLLLFLVQQDLGEQWQRAMNYEQVDVARQIQKRKGEVSSHLHAFLVPASRTCRGVLYLCVCVCVCRLRRLWSTTCSVEPAFFLMQQKQETAWMHSPRQLHCNLGSMKLLSNKISRKQPSSVTSYKQQRYPLHHCFYLQLDELATAQHHLGDFCTV